jgi:hypothetical protein
MFTILLESIAGVAFLGSLFWCSSRDCVALLLVAWTLAIGAFVYSNLAERFLWIPVLLALAGVFGSVFALVVPTNITLAVNEAILATFLVALKVLKSERRSSMTFARHHA